MLMGIGLDANAQTWDFTQWTAGNLSNAHYYKADGTASADAPTDSLGQWLYVDASDIVPYTKETSTGGMFYVQPNTRAKLYGGISATDASEANAYQPSRNFLRLFLSNGCEVTVKGKAGNGGNTLCLSLNGQEERVADLQSNQEISLKNRSGHGCYAYIYSAGQGVNKQNYAAMVISIAVKDSASVVADSLEYTMPTTWQTTPQHRALWACQTTVGSTFVSWRARMADPDGTEYRLYRNGALVASLTDRTNVTLEGTGDSYATDSYKLEVVSGGSIIETAELKSGGVKAHNYLRIKLADEPTVTNTGTMWNASGKDDGYTVRYTPNDMTAYDMDGDGEEELIVKWDPSNSQDNGYSGYTANVYIDCYKPDFSQPNEDGDYTAQLLWRINLGQNIRAGAHYTQFLCYDFDGDGKGEMMVKTSLGTKDGLDNYVFQSRIDEKKLDVTRDYTRTNDAGTAVKSNGHVGVGEEWLTVFEGATGRELASTDYYPKFSVSDWTEGTASNKYNKGTRFKACVARLDGVHPSAVFNRGYYTQSYFTAYNWNGKHLYELWRHASIKEGEGLYGEGAHSLVVGDFDGDGKDEIGVGAAALDHDGTLFWRSGYGHGDALHLGDFDTTNDGLEIFYVNEEYKQSDVSTALFDARTGSVLKSRAQTGMDTGRGLAAHVSGAHEGTQLFSKGDGDKAGETYLTEYTDGTPDWLGGSGNYGWQNGSLTKSYTGKDEYGHTVNNDVASYPNFRIYWDGDLLDEWMDSRHVDKWNDEAMAFERLFTFDTPTHRAYSTGGTKEAPCLQTDLFGDWREEVIFYDCDTTATETRTATSKTYGEVTIEWPVKQFYLTVFTTTIPTAHKLPWLRDDHVYDMAIAWQNVGYNQPPHLSYDPTKGASPDNGGTTTIKSLASEQAEKPVYNMQGQRMAKDNLPKGIYIQGNKKISIR